MTCRLRIFFSVALAAQAVAATVSGSVRLVEPDFAGRLSGFTLLFEALILMLAQQMPFAAVARIVGESAYRVMEVCNRYVELALEQAGDPEISARIQSYEMAYRLQTSAPELMDLRSESKETLAMYGADPDKPSFARACILARRELTPNVFAASVGLGGGSALLGIFLSRRLDPAPARPGQPEAVATGHSPSR